jgi:hypothetical protein
LPAAAAAARPAAAPAPSAADIRNLKKSWSRADTTKLARMGRDRAYLVELIPDHSPAGDLDWELISKYFGR